VSNGNNDVFARSPTSAYPPAPLIRPFELNNEGGGQALVLRYASCNLRCPLCYAWRYAWFIKNGYRYNIYNSINTLRNLPQVARKKIVWVRIQGGEPCLTFHRILNTITFAVESLDIIHTNGLNYFKTTRAVIQTNAITFSKLTSNQISQILSHLKNLLQNLDKGRVVFEVSFKSPSNLQYLNPQINGYRVLLNQIIMPLWNQGFDNIAVYPVAGLGPSIDGDNLFIIPIDPQSLPNEAPLFHSSTWSSQFQNLVNHFINNIVPNYKAYDDFRRNNKTNGGRKLAIEELEPTLFQSSWISGYAGGYNQYNINITPINRVLRKLTEGIPTDPRWRSWYSSWTSKKLFGRSASWRSVLNQIPASNNPNELLFMVKQMNNYFYPSHPIGHYPYL